MLGALGVTILNDESFENCMNRRSFLLMTAGLLASTGVQARGTTAEILRAELPRVCGRRAAAIEATLTRLSRLKPPTSGRTITVDLPSQQLVAYQDGSIVMECRVVIGDEGWRTPDLDTVTTFVRFNPTWTVPESIVSARRWRDKVLADPSYFENLNFRIEAGGRMMTPTDVSESGLRPVRFVQQPGRSNALGRVKIGLAAGGSVYLHDTNDQEAFGEDDRAQSHGCIRVEKAMELAAWVMGIDPDAAREMRRGGDKRDHRPGPVRVVTTYFTAWPDDQGVVQYYPDIYARDRRVARCSSDTEPMRQWVPSGFPSDYEVE
ncbi:L,D-transpeptidase family protein [Bosea sp. RAC05]|uniref:L,D-transpeptidase family protein n=1 Tax=Bosea sp. RAC05 TaxID=1842539 RepID=UPI001F013695|nr:L,D-transpeptidase family protein [Bosea sp. RAC05]